MGTVLTVCLAAASMAANPALEVQGQKLTIRTGSVEVAFDGPALTSVRAADGTEFIQPASEGQPLDVFFLNGESFGQDKHQKVAVRQLSPLGALIAVEGKDTKRSLLVTVNAATGDVLVTPDGIAHRRGLRSVGWRVSLHPEAEAILPVINGLRVRQGQPRPSDGRFAWPFEWNAQLIIAQRGGTAMMIHSEDRSQQFKALQLRRKQDHSELVLETESPGPLWDNRTAGGVAWRINTYAGDWKKPAARYRKWMHAAYDLAGKRQARPEWVGQVSLAVSWAGPNEAMLDALAAAHPPQETLIHLSDWRTDKYDVNYPEYTAREDALKYLAKAAAMGFHVLPHFNYFAVWYRHPFFSEVSDFQIRSPDKNEPQGWHWPPETHDYTRMGFLHPGLGLWRQTLIPAVLAACARTGAPGAFLDQTLCTWNTDNGLVQGRTTLGGMELLEEQFNAVRPELVLAGEGLHEISFQRQCFAQAHIYDGWRGLEAWHPEVIVPIGSYLWADHCRLFGYYHLTPGDKLFELGVEVYERMGALPTLITGRPEDLRQPSPLTRRVLERAQRWRRITATAEAE